MNKDKNIWIINHYAIPPSIGGLNRHYYFAKELISRGYNVRIFTSSAIHNTDINMIENDVLFSDISVDGITYTYIKSSSYKGNGLARIKNMFGFAFLVQKIKKHFSTEKPDIIYTSSPDLFTAFSAEILAKRLNIPCICEIRDLWPLSIVEYKNMSPRNPIIVALYMLEKWIYRKASALIFTMEGGKQYVIDKKWNKKIDTNKIFNVNNGVDLERYEDNINEFVIDDSDLNNEETFKIIYCGSIREANNIGLLVDVAKKFGNEEKIQFIMFGGGEDIEKYRQRCENENIKNVVFKGQVNKKYIPYILSKSNLNILNYKNVNTWKYGGSQNKMFEYMASGKPLLSTIKMGYSLIERYNCGVEIEEQNIENIYLAINNIKNLCIDKYNKMCNNAKNAAKDFDFKVLTDKIEEVINFTMEKK